MKTTVKMPRVSDTVDEVEVVDIPVSVGARVEEGDTVVSVDADKTTVDIPAPVAGTVTSILVKIADEISTGDPILTMDT